MTNPEYLIAISLPIVEGDDKFEENKYSMYHEPDLFSFDEIDKIKEYISHLEEDLIFLLTLIKPNYNVVYKDGDDWNYDDCSDKWEAPSEREGTDIFDVKSAIKEWSMTEEEFEEAVENGEIV